jgi:hypothetical protein
MKSKAKPAKGSARTKRFDVGGTVGALAGLGTLAYLMSRKKKGADGEYKPQGKFPQEDGSGTSTSKPEPYVAADAEENTAKKEALSKGMQYKKPESPTAVENSIKTTTTTTDNAPKSVIKKAKSANKTTPSSNQGSSTNTDPASTTRADDVIGAGVRSGEAQAKSDAAKKAANLAEARKKAQAEADAKTAPRRYLENKAGLSGKGITTPGLRTSKEATLEPSARTKNVIKAVQGTLDNAGKSTVRSDTDKMRERALEVERRRKEEKAAKQGYGIKKGGMVKKYANGGSVMASKMGSVKTAKPSMRSASSRADGIAQRGKTRA